MSRNLKVSTESILTLSAASKDQLLFLDLVIATFNIYFNIICHA